MRIFLLFCLSGFAFAINAQIIISQYVETNSGTTPKGIELLNVSGAGIDFSVFELEVRKGTNGNIPTTDFTLNSGLLPAGEVIVIGTSNMQTASTESGDCSLFETKSFTFNGDDALEIYLNGTLTDVFGDPGDDPGSSWSGNGVSTANQNIQLKSGITTGNLTGFTDPSIRFEMVGNGSDLTGFGVPTDGCPIVAPVSLLALEVAKVNKTAELTWSTANESGNDFFAIERSVDGGRTFSQIGEVKGFGTTNERQDYNFVDLRPVSGESFYRLRQVDFDGTFELFGPVSIRFGKDLDGPQPNVYPNPANDQLFFSNVPEGLKEATIINVLGRVVKQINNLDAKATASIHVSDLRPGIYLLRYELNGEPATIKFLKR